MFPSFCLSLWPTSMMLIFAPLWFLISLIFGSLLPITTPMMPFGTLISYFVSLSWLSSLLLPPPLPPPCLLAKSTMATKNVYHNHSILDSCPYDCPCLTSWRILYHLHQSTRCPACTSWCLPWPGCPAGRSRCGRYTGWPPPMTQSPSLTFVCI